MLGSNTEGNGRLIAWTRLASRWGTLCFAFCALLMVVGCPGVNPPTTCTADTDCTASACNTATCNADGVCEEAPIDGCCEDDADCEATEICASLAGASVGVCTPRCADDADCDDGDACTTDTCAAFICVNVDNSADCDDGDFCNGAETCDSATGCVAGTDPCGADEICNETDDTCDAAPCTDDADCTDDGNACTAAVCNAGVCETSNVANGTACADGDACTSSDVCTDGVCGGTAIAGCCTDNTDCAAGETCDTNTNTCIAPGSGFDLTTDDDALTGTTGNDTFTGLIGTLNPGDIVVGNGGDDVLNVTVAGGTSSNATIIDVDQINFNTLNATTFDATNCAAVGSYNVNGTGGMTLTNIEGDSGVRMGAGFDNAFSVALSDATGGADELNLTIDGTEAGASFVAADGADIETLNLDVVGSVISAANPGVDFFGGVGETIVTGAGDLNLEGFTDAAGADLAADGIDTTDFDGNLWLWPGADAGNLVLNFAGGDLVGIDRYVIQDTTTFDHTIIPDPADGPLTVDVSSIDEDDAAGALIVVQGDTEDDFLTLILGGDGDGAASLQAAETQELTIDSSGTTPNALGFVNVNFNGFSLGVTPKRIDVIGDQDLDMGNVVADIVDCTGATGGVTLTSAAPQIDISCGSGDDDLTGGGAVDFIDGGDGDNAIDGAGGDDQITCGTGNCTVTGGAGDDDTTLGDGDNTLVCLSVFAAAGTNNDGADSITGFNIGDMIELDASNGFADGTGDLSNNGAVTDNTIDIDNDGTDTTIIIDINTDGTTAALTIVLLGVTLTDADFTFDATDNLLISE